MNDSNLDYSICPNPPAPNGFTIEDLSGKFYDYLSTQDFDALCYCTHTETSVDKESGKLNSIVECNQNSVNGTFRQYHLWMKQNGTDSLNGHGDSIDYNPSKFMVYNSSFGGAFIGEQVNYFWQKNGTGYAFASCVPYNTSYGYFYELHVIQDISATSGNVLTSTDINEVFDLIAKYNLNPGNKSLKIEPHPSSCVY